jgi:hypothetical protein
LPYYIIFFDVFNDFYARKHGFFSCWKFLLMTKGFSEGNYSNAQEAIRIKIVPIRVRRTADDKRTWPDKAEKPESQFWDTAVM